ncbi:helix-turn-helix transcriptional regulator [Oceanidesulfovibrio marinus]|uniref:DNA-binding protein n=1 Tax=Oceanidesulfovibrio marinus TaxID=370038 RepID=A0A6P1ZE67_9BACT|nr:helix-turn-helix domain-containing protein [Oceanidesulfovibrio marinus]TVM32126.1 DNA-binding protein [Oceanidesulfovibrio marinus]
MESKKFLTTKEAAALTGRSKKALEVDRQNGRGLPYVRLGPRCIRYRIEDIQAYAEQNRVDPEA